ncbi:Topless-related protein 1 [Spatholobus suberectus]|nr:Topless-related protein 1 [Spatholobus suberectus]
MSFNLNKELALLVLQYFDEEDFKEAARTFGRESGLYFDLKYFEDMVLEGNWDEAENYLSGFTKHHQNPDQEPHLLMDRDSNSQPSTSVLTYSGAAMEWKPSTNGRPSMDSDERDCNGVFGDVKPYSTEESHNKSKNLFDICTPSLCQSLQLPKHPEVKKIVRLAYNNAGNSILALASNGIHLVWLWPRTSFNLDGKASAQVCSQLWQPKDGLQFMINDLTTVKCGNPISCFALSKKDGYVISTSGGMVSLFNMVTFKTLRTIMSPPPMVTCLAFYPEDNNIFGIGFDDSSIVIYHVRDHEIILWNTNGWEKLKERHLQIEGNPVPVSETQIQFHPDQINFLVVHINHLAIYEATELGCVNQWVPEVPVLISQATFSSDGHTVYSIFVDGTVAIFDASNFQLRCRVYPSSYLSSTSSLSIYPISIAAHPHKPTQFAVGLTDGSVYVFEPREPEGDWIKSH